MRLVRKSMILLAVALVFGAIRMPFESALRGELEKSGLIPRELEVGTKQKLGQTFAAVSLGGLRTLVATFYNLRAFSEFTEQRWGDVARTFDLIVTLAPHTRYYWETGYWHQAYNAASYYINEEKLPAERRREAWRESIHAGLDFLERGIRNNPDDWSLWANKGFLLSDPNKFPAFRDQAKSFEEAAEAYRKAEATGRALPYVKRFSLYALARVPGREDEALEIARRFYNESERNHTPTLLSLLFVLEAHADASQDMEELAVRLFGTKEKAFEQLGTHWQRTRDRFPVYGVAEALQRLGKDLDIPAGENPLNQPLPPPPGPDQWFSQ
ncbi:MAG: hypothetical protein H7A50_01540 [Akkermansiaceae bacterium]|nr:hypothetical protein [Akkermansiaceae bacterium]